ncbi:hypothetical protein [Williamsia sp. CHRR-6]|uniref:hypothetical protein n=1 Tax=Williamsia sp. CHRR-6 TaxID=2835871 RepID=UPI001BDA41CD|nr:hypothetical protein [Williamsia sp. CHRR-6]MBT0565831.1 hypothetical protein [Williamsia sp. CHRR-6]
MSQSATEPDPVMEQITAAVTAHRAGSGQPRDDLIALWSRLTPAGDPLHRCVLAHHLADRVDDPAQALMWDVRALDAADLIDDARAAEQRLSLQVAAFYPSLHLNIADNLRRLGSFGAAGDHVAAARARAGALADLGPEHSDYVTLLRTLIDEIAALVTERSSAPRDTRA